MNLDTYSGFKKYDTQNMLAEINGLPEQLKNAWKLGQTFPLPGWDGIERVLIAGMGGSAIGASLLASYAAPLSEASVFVHRNYDLPAWAKGQETLVITSSHSGNTEETVSAFDAAITQNCRVLAVTTGGKIAAKAKKHDVNLWQFEHEGQPRAAVGYSFGLLLSVFARLGLLPNPEEEVQDTALALKEQQKKIQAAVPQNENPAKRLANELVGRWVSVFSAGLLAPVARRWKGQISELAKALAQFEALPEADHNTLAGAVNPRQAFSKTTAVFLVAESNHPRNKLRIKLTKKGMAEAGMNTQVVEAVGESRLAQLWTALHQGDYVAFYLAMAYEIDPTPVAAIESLKKDLAAFR